MRVVARSQRRGLLIGGLLIGGRRKRRAGGLHGTRYLLLSHRLTKQRIDIARVRTASQQRSQRIDIERHAAVRLTRQPLHRRRKVTHATVRAVEPVHLHAAVGSMPLRAVRDLAGTQVHAVRVDRVARRLVWCGGRSVTNGSRSLRVLLG